MGTAWTMYLSDSKGRLPESVWSSAPAGADLDTFVWNNFWFGLLNRYKVNGSQLLCPEAADPIPMNMTAFNGGVKGGGTAKYAWSGIHQTQSVGIYLSTSGVNLTNDATKKGYRIGSYGFNGNLYWKETRDPDPGTGGSSGANFGPKINFVRGTSEVPVYYDCTWIENRGMTNGTAPGPTPPPNLKGENVPAGSDYHRRILLDRHAGGINIAFADGHAGRVICSDLYNQKWTPYWRKYSLTNLPKK